jgi:predicted CXXCH cytochrome family protein
VIGGVHDFSRPGSAVADACSGCHIPHVQAIRPTAAPRTATQPVIEIYRIPGQRRVFQPDRYTPGPSSLLCLGCHDGTVATSTIGSSHALLAGVREGFDLPRGFAWRDHPIGVRYPEGRRDYRPLAYVTKDGRVPLPDGRIECVSCHDPHNVAGIDKLLVKSNRRSALCLTCHIK